MSIVIKVPATSANLGPGFDVSGLALDKYNVFHFEKADEYSVVCSVDEKVSDNLIVFAMRFTYEKLGVEDIPASIVVDEGIPISHGIGSSSSCICAGVAAALILAGEDPTIEKIIKYSTAIEGHPDNVVPAVLGNLTSTIIAEGKVIYTKRTVHGDLRLLLVVPDFRYSTEVARKLLPTSIPRQDAIFNMSRIPLLIDALESGETENLRIFLEDRLHQKYRMEAIGKINGKFSEVFDYVGSITEGVYISGAGPTMIAFVHQKDAEEKLKDTKKFISDNKLNWEASIATPITTGIEISVS